MKIRTILICAALLLSACAPLTPQSRGQALFDGMRPAVFHGQAAE